MGKVIATTSGKGGVGKSTVSIGLAFAYCRLGKNVLLIDMDEGLRCLDLMLGADSSTVFDLSDILLGKDITQAIYKIDAVKGLSLIPAPAKPGMIDTFNFTSFVNEIKDKYDIIIFDFPAGIDFTLYECLPDDSLFLTVAVPDPVSIRDSSTVSSRLDEIARHSRLVINCFDYSPIKKGIFNNIDSIIDTSCLQLIGVIPKSEELQVFSVTHKLKINGKAMRAFIRTAKRIDGEAVLLPKPKKI